MEIPDKQTRTEHLRCGASLRAAREKQEGSIIRKLHEIQTWKSDRF